MKRLSPAQYARILYELAITRKGEKEIVVAVAAFMKLLQKHHALRKINAIIQAFADYADEQSGHMPVAVTTARPLESGLRKKIEEQLGAVIREEDVDTDLIGGVIVKAASVLFDASIRAQLRHLHSQLAS